MASNVEIIINAKDNASGVLNGISNTLGNMAKTAGIAAAALGAAFLALGKQALDATAEWERMEMTMQSLVARELKAADSTLTMSAALEQATGRSEELLGWIQKLAIESPFDLEGVATAFRTALAYGFTSEQAQRLTQNMIDFAAGTGQSVTVMNQIALALGQVQAKGRLAGQEILQLVNAGVPVNDILKSMGFTLDDVSAGLVTADKFLAAFSETMESDFGGAAARQTNTWAGLLNSLGDIKKIGLRELFAGVFEVLQPLVAKFAEWLQGDGLERIREMGAILGGLAQNLINGFKMLQSGELGTVIVQKLSEAWTFVTGKFHDVMASVDWTALSQAIAEKINEIDWSVVGNNLILGIQNILLGLWEFLSNVDWAALFDSITMAVAEFIAGLFGTTFEDVRARADAFWADLGAKFQQGLAAIGAAIEAWKAFWIGMWEKLRDIAVGAFNAFVNGVLAGISPIIGAFNAIGDAISGVIGWIKNLAASFMDLVIPDWLTPGSPTPFELGLLGIKDALQKVSVATPNLGLFNAPAGAMGGAGAGGGMVTVNLTYSPVMSLGDETELKTKLVPFIISGVKEARAQGVIQ